MPTEIIYELVLNSAPGRRDQALVEFWREFCILRGAMKAKSSADPRGFLASVALSPCCPWLQLQSTAHCGNCVCG